MEEDGRPDASRCEADEWSPIERSGSWEVLDDINDRLLGVCMGGEEVMLTGESRKGGSNETQADV